MMVLQSKQKTSDRFAHLRAEVKLDAQKMRKIKKQVEKLAFAAQSWAEHAALHAEGLEGIWAADQAGWCAARCFVLAQKYTGSSNYVKSCALMAAQHAQDAQKLINK